MPQSQQEKEAQARQQAEAQRQQQEQEQVVKQQQAAMEQQQQDADSARTADLSIQGETQRPVQIVAEPNDNGTVVARVK